ncbi:MAG: septation protein IspZ [Porphyrobacter sp.]|nr:septation protein IspZ [Porphyrobacter sp.]
MSEVETKKPKSGWINVAVDYGPLLVFFLSYRYFRPDGQDIAGEIFAVVRSTGAFIAASLVALAISKWRLGRISPMLWLSTVLIVGFGTLTIYTGNEWWIQRKPTVIYTLFAVALIIGWLNGKALLKYLLEAAFDGLNDEGWLKLSRNWGFFFVFLAVLNEILANTLSFESWLAAKLWVFLPLSFGFTFTQLPMLLRHGLSTEGTEDEKTNPPPTG